MIIDCIENIELYENFHKDLKKGFEFALSLRDKPKGKYECDDIFAFVQEDVTKEYALGKTETHLKYLDVHIMFEGEEILGYENADKLSVETDYDDIAEAIFYKGELKNIKIEKDMFFILHTKDAHRTCVHIDKETTYKKVVLKLALK